MRSHKLISGSFLNTINLIAQILSGFYVMPLLIHTFGDTRFGIWILVGSFMGYAAILDLGLPSAVSRFISQAIGRGGESGRKEISHITSTAFYIFLGITALTMVLIGLVIGFAPVFIKDEAYIELFRQLLLILCLNNLVVFPTSIFEGVLAANLRYDLINSRKIVFTVVRLVATILIVKSQGTLIQIAWMTAVTNILENLIRVSQCYQIDKDVSISLRNFKSSMVRQLFGYSIYSFIGRVADMMRFQINAVVISMSGSVAQVTPFRIAARLIEYFMQLISGVTGVFSPYFSQEEGKNNFEAIREKFLFITKIISYVATFIGGMLILFGKDFIERWMGPQYGISYEVLVILAVPMTLALMQSAVFSVLYGISKHRFVASINVIEGIFNLIISLILVKRLGIIGVALGMAIPMIVTKSLVQPVYVTRVLGIPLMNYLKTLLGSFLKCAAALGGTWFLIASYVRPDYKNLLFFAALQTAVFLVMLYVCGFTKIERQYLFAVLKKR